MMPKTVQAYNTERHKGVAIRVVKKILGEKTYVAANWIMQGKSYEVKGDTKDYVVGVAKQKIDKILGR